jgi:formate-dependent nitrite reductase membrane component NrfD
VKMGTMVVGIIMMVVALIMFPIILDAVSTILGNANIADYTGLETMVAIAPLLVFIGLLAGGGWLTFKGLTAGRTGKGKSDRSLM